MFSLVAFLLSRFVRHVVGWVLLALLLILAAPDLRPLRRPRGRRQRLLVGELVGIAIYSAMGLRGVRGSTWWLVAGWALYPVWDVALHFFGPGHAFAPETYTITCLSFDLVVAAYVAVAYRFGLVGPRQTEMRGASVPAR